MIKAAVSRQREFLADAVRGAVHPQPARAVGRAPQDRGSAGGSKLQNHHAQEAGHFFFSEGVRSAARGTFATHPPLDVRIKRVDPAWDGTFLQPTPVQAEQLSRKGAGPRSEGSAAGGTGAGAPGGPGGAMPFPLPFPVPGFPAGGRGVAGAAVGAVAAAGTLDAGQLEQARSILDGVPEDVRSATRSADGAVAVVVGLLWSDEPTVQERQAGAVEEALGAETLARARKLAPGIRAAGASRRLPLLELCLPALRSLDLPRAEAVRDVVGTLTRADGEIHVFEFALFHLLRRALPGDEDGVRSGRVGPGLARRRGETETLLSALAWAGSGEPEGAERAFREGAARFGGRAAAAVRLQPVASLDLERVDEALGRLETLPPADRRTLLDALERTVHADRAVTVDEIELLRAVAEALDVPMPPMAVTEPPGSGPGEPA